jgi:HlyD family secretion protein
VVNLFFVIGASFLFAGCHDKAKEEEAEGPVTVQAAPVQLASFERTVRAAGMSSSLPGRQALVSSAVDGLVAEIVVSPGEAVKAGQPLVRLDDRLARADLDEKKLARSELEASLVLLKALPREPERRAAGLEVDRAKVAIDLAQAALTRLEPLHAKKEISDPQLYEAQQRLAEAQLAGKAAEARLAVLVLGPRPEAVAEAEVKIARAAAAVNAAETRLSYFTLAAPRAGRVSRILCREGQALKPGDLAVDVLDASEVLVTAGVPAHELAGIEVGKEARVSLRGSEAAGSDAASELLAGKVAFIGPEASSATGAIPVGIIVPAAGGCLKPGVAVMAEIVTGMVTGALAVPEDAVLPSEKGPTVVVIRDGKAATLPVQVGSRGHGLVEVKAEGLKAGELAITMGGYNLEDGAAVKVEEKEPPEKAPEKSPEKSETSPEILRKKVPENPPENPPEKVPENPPEKVLEKSPENARENPPEKVPDNSPVKRGSGS